MREVGAWIRRVTVTNAGAKVGALALALFVWLYVTSARTYEVALRMPLFVMDLPDSLVVVNELPASAEVRLHGRGDRLLWLRVQEPRVELSLKGEREGSLTRTLEPADVMLPQGSRVEVRQVVSPRVFQVEVDRLLVRKVPLRCAVEGTPASGHARVPGDPLLVPDEVRVRGPAGRVAGLRAMPVGPVSIAGARDTVVSPVKVHLPRIKHLTVEPATVTATVPIEPVRDVTVRGIPVRAQAAATVSPPTVAVVVTVPQSRMAEAGALDSSEVQARVDATRGDAAPTVDLPSWVLSARTVPPRVTVTPLEQ